MEKLQIEWGDVERTESIEKDIKEKSEKIFKIANQATNLVVNLKIVNPYTSAGVPTQRVSMELRLPQHQDVRAEKEGDDLYKSIKETQLALLSQVKAKKAS